MFLTMLESSKFLTMLERNKVPDNVGLYSLKILHCEELPQDNLGSVHVKNAPDPYPYPYP